VGGDVLFWTASLRRPTYGRNAIDRPKSAGSRYDELRTFQHQVEKFHKNSPAAS
jgi:hypothetical protein